jgi:hypothetical protein
LIGFGCLNINKQNLIWKFHCTLGSTSSFIHFLPFFIASPSFCFFFPSQSISSLLILQVARLFPRFHSTCSFKSRPLFQALAYRAKSSTAGPSSKLFFAQVENNSSDVTACCPGIPTMVYICMPFSIFLFNNI